MLLFLFTVCASVKKIFRATQQNVLFDKICKFSKFYKFSNFKKFSKFCSSFGRAMLSPLRLHGPLEPPPVPPGDGPDRLLCLVRTDTRTVYRPQTAFRHSMLTIVALMAVLLVAMATALFFVTRSQRLRRPLEPVASSSPHPATKHATPPDHFKAWSGLPGAVSGAPARLLCRQSQKQILEAARNVSEVRVMADIKVEGAVRAALLQV